MTTLPFDGIRGGVQNITTSGTSQSVTISESSNSVRLVNTGTTNPCHVRIGRGSQTATTADTVVRANSEIVLRKADGENTVAVLQSGGATTLYIQPGQNGV
jgi:hypothetical protein